MGRLNSKDKIENWKLKTYTNKKFFCRFSRPQPQYQSFNRLIKTKWIVMYPFALHVPLLPLHKPRSSLIMSPSLSRRLCLGPAHFPSPLCSRPGSPLARRPRPQAGLSGRTASQGHGALRQSCCPGAKPRRAPGEPGAREPCWEALGPGPWGRAPTRPSGSDRSRSTGAPDPGEPRVVLETSSSAALGSRPSSGAVCLRPQQRTTLGG